MTTGSDEITAIVPDVLYRVGTTVPVDHLSWVGAGRTGFDPQNAFVLIDGDEAVFIDTGPAIARDAIERALDEVVAGRRVSIFPTRNEAESIGNLGLLFARGRDARLLFGGGGGILEWVNHPDAPAAETRNFLGQVPIVPAANGTSMAIGERLVFDWFDAPIKQMLLTQWAYERSTKTLFTSDFFTWVHQAHVTDPVVVTEASPSVDDVAADIVSRINWLPGAHCPDVVTALREVFSTYAVETIAPDHGCVLSGAAAVAAHLELALRALDLVTV